jgi:hypothetical protein
MTEDVLAGELLNMLDLEVVPGLGAEIVLDLPPFVCWRLHDVKHEPGTAVLMPATTACCSF